MTDAVIETKTDQKLCWCEHSLKQHGAFTGMCLDIDCRCMEYEPVIEVQK